MASRNSSGWRQIDATELKAPIDAPATETSIVSSLQSLRIAGTTSSAMQASNAFCRRAQ